MGDIIKETEANLFFINGDRKRKGGIKRETESEEKHFCVCFAMFERLLG